LDDAKIEDNFQRKSNPMMSTPSIEISCENDTPSPSSVEMKPQSPTLIDLREDKSEIVPLPQVPGSPVKVVKRKAPVPTPDAAQQDISISRPVGAKVPSNQGMIPPPPSKAEEVKLPLQIPMLSTTPATPLPVQKQFASMSSETQAPVVKTQAPETPTPAVIASDFKQSFSSTEALVSSKDPSLDANMAASSPPSCLRPVNKIEDVKTIKRQMKTGWL
jgi:transient-receptor-potential-like protein